MMHVLFLPKWYPNKYDPFDGNFIENHAHAIKLRTKVSVLFAHSEINCPNKYRIEKIDNRGLTEVRVFYQKPNTGINLLDKVVSFVRYRKAQKLGYQKLFKENEKPDLVHIHVLSRPAFLALALKRKHSIPFVITEHWSGYLKSNGKYKGFLKKRFTEYIAKKASRINTVSTQLKDSMISHELYNEYEVIPNVVDTELFKPLPKKNSITEIIFVGNLLQRPKKVFDIIKGMKSLKDAGKNFHLSIYGEGVDELAAKKLCSDLSLNSFVSFKGTRDRKGIGEAMGLSDFLILFSEFENQPCVISEGHASGIPMIVPDLLGIAERMKPELGILVQTGNQAKFEKALLQMVDNHQFYDSDYIRYYGVSQFGEKEIANQFYNFYKKAL
jgi:glycosyltransferase involved in cell wall biosynthesis